jgi:hypothetical protein
MVCADVSNGIQIAAKNDNAIFHIDPLDMEDFPLLHTLAITAPESNMVSKPCQTVFYMVFFSRSEGFWQQPKPQTASHTSAHAKGVNWCLRYAPNERAAGHATLRRPKPVTRAGFSEAMQTFRDRAPIAFYARAPLAYSKHFFTSAGLVAAPLYSYSM